VPTAIPHWVVEQLAWGLNESGKAVRGSRILILGVAYKKDVDDIRESPALEIMELLEERGAELSYHDPYTPRLHKMRKHDFSNMASVELSPEFLGLQDAVLIATDHTKIDYEWIVRHSRHVVDTRNATRNVSEGREKIVRA
jgi:UDP-N-acetyl-D-glucosamine dehydrogenase